MESTIRQLAEDKNKAEKKAQLVVAMQRLLVRREEQEKQHKLMMDILEADEKLIESGEFPSWAIRDYLYKDCDLAKQ